MRIILLLLCFLLPPSIFAAEEAGGSETANPVKVAVKTADQASKLVEDRGMLVMVGTLFLACGVSALWLIVRFYNRKISGDYVPKDEVLALARKLDPKAFKPAPTDLPDLRNHRLFPAASKFMRAAEASGASGEMVDYLARDLAVWTLRAYRDVFHDIVEGAYSNKEGFDAYLGDDAALRARIDNAFTELGAAVRYRLVEEFNFPPRIYDLWQNTREDFDRLMSDVVDLAMEHTDPYWRLRTTLDSVFVRCSLVRSHVTQFFKTLSPDVLKNVSYSPSNGVDASTMHQLGKKTPAFGTSGYPASIFEKSRKTQW